MRRSKRGRPGTASRDSFLHARWRAPSNEGLRDAGPRATAVLASNTLSGIGALNATLDAGIDVADQSAVHLSAASTRE
jgi:DNA-binding LacI/PurR family transcriptional regulator